MTFGINASNYRLYFNLTGGDRLVTVAVSGAATVEIKAANGAQLLKQAIANHGGVVSLRVPSQHSVEIDAPSAGVQVEVLGTN